ncbi:polyhydroxyalkanoate depolymerase [Cupriavidus necator]
MEISRQRANQALFNPVALWNELICSTAYRSILQLAEASRSQQFAQCYGLFQQAIKALGTPAFDIEQVEFDGRRMQVSESVVMETEFCRLRSFSCERGRAGKVACPILLCAPLAGHHTALMREVVQSLLPHADTYVSDWVDANDIPRATGDLHLGDVVLTLQHFMVELKLAELDVLAVCRATVPALASAARLVGASDPEPRSLVLLGGPIDPRCDPTPLTRMAGSLPPSWFDSLGTHIVPSGYRGAGRRVYPGFRQYPSLIMGQPERQLFLLFNYIQSQGAGDAQAVREAERSIAHACGVPPGYPPCGIPASAAAQGHLARGRESGTPGSVARDPLADHCGQPRHDFRSRPHPRRPDLCVGVPAERRRRITITGCDHSGLFGGPHWRTAVYPAVHDWLVGSGRSCSPAGTPKSDLARAQCILTANTIFTQVVPG